ncbi:hypothetical protein CBG60_00895 [Fusobacterium animalis]|uniref:Uncharacterized protein n=1 Tax=Fusobacterium animalis 7_1 TaxID=457405 RepID=A0A140PSP8_9FUSO|nr:MULTISPECIES: hypothetical protein [Fusobacterium]ASG29970.1 hypothetical protein CBG60_00895 [Fusobacterium animalis]EEO42815.1 hypothetical protein FSDG_01374 [Fusobacterium animalis 7_1]EPC07713.1 hypothetical protein HMPREF9369_02525 [Fusobacterium polymorphum F0401]ERT41894.1 hypothetical protein HMPREF1538_00724 [Fusobacterium nucleatum CTI-1]BEO88976.1 hypothetical protein FNCA3_03040 [Fusobacterium nucleatum]
MNFEPLYELKNRLENVAVVGINLAKDDFRLQRAVEQVKEYSTVAKVFKQIYDMGQKLISTDNEDKCDIFLDLLALLDAVLCTQATTYSGEKPQEIKSIAKTKDFYKELHYSELSPLIYAFTENGGGRLFTIQNAVDNNSEIFNDFRLKSYMINGLSDKYSEIVNLATKQLKKQRKEIIPLLKDGFSPRGGKEMLARLDVISHIAKEDENDFYKYCIENGSKEIKEYAIGYLSYDQKNTDYLLDLTKTEKGKLKNKVFEALSYMSDNRAAEEWGKFLKKKPLDNIEYLRGTNQQWAIEYFNNFMEEYITELKNKTLKTAEERRTVENEINRISWGILNKESEKTLLFCKELYPYNKAEIKRILNFYIAKDLNKEIIDLIKELSKKYEGEFLQQEFLISLIKDKAETTYKNFSKYAGAGKEREEVRALFNTFIRGDYSKNKEERKVQENFRDMFQIILRMHYDEENKEYILEWPDTISGYPIQIKLDGFDKKWYDIILSTSSEISGNWEYYSSSHGDFRYLYNPDIKGLKEKFAEFYYNITLLRTPYLSDIEFLNKLDWTSYKDFLVGKMDIGKNIYLLSYRLSYISDFINKIPISEEDLKTQIEELLEKYKNLQKSTIDLCQRWLDKLNSGVKVKEL